MAAGGLADSASTRKGDGMAGGPPAAVRPAATVVLHRAGASGLEVFWVRRGEQLRFAGGFYAFPGGRVDVGDAALPLLNAERLPASEAACIAAAARELFEETGVLLAPGAARVAADARRAARSLAMGLPAAVPLLQDPSRAPWGLPVHDWVVERIEFQRGIVVVPLRTPTLPPATHTNCLLLGDEELWVVDPGSPYPEEQAILEKTLALLDEEGRRAVGVLLTHHHQDHVGGAVELARQRSLPIATTVQTAELLDFRVDRVLRDGDSLQVGPRGWKCLHLPGHTRGHLCLLEEGSGAVVAGDLVAGIGTVIVDPPEGDMLDYLASLRRLLELGPGVIYPAHGPVVPAGADKLRGYLAHRLEREERVVRALREVGPATPAQLVPASYPDVPARLHPPSESALLAHLGKLVKEGRAGVDERGRYSADRESTRLNSSHR